MRKLKLFVLFCFLLAMKSVFEPYRDIKDNLHKDLTAKLLATDAVIKQTITQIFRSKV